jgi:hypothetical protein
MIINRKKKLAVMKNNTPKITDYKGYTISTQLDGHCSLIYKAKSFISAVAAENSPNNIASIEKAKKYIDSIS